MRRDPQVTITGTMLPAGVFLGTTTAAGTIVGDEAVRLSIEAGSAAGGSPPP